MNIFGIPESVVWEVRARFSKLNNQKHYYNYIIGKYYNLLQ